MAIVGIVTHQNRNSAAAQAADLASWLIDEGHRVLLPAGDAEAVGVGEAVDVDDHFGADLDLVVSMGGDGSILRTVHLLGDEEVPIVGVNHGEMGYLAPFEPADAHDAVRGALDGHARIEHRMMVQARLVVDGVEEVHHALNDIVVERGATSTTIRVEVAIDGAVFHTYAADGIIVASPTGSTAYSLSARGPVLAAEHHALLVTAVSPHQLFDRSMVLAPSSVVDLQVKGHREARLAIDGRTVATLSEGKVVHVTTSPRVVHLVSAGPRQFHEVLKAKFGLRDRG